MKGLILKDLYNLSRQYKVIVGLIIFYVILSMKEESTFFFGGFMALLMMMQVITALAYDERSKWDRYALAMPVSRADLVLSKYVLGGILSAFAFTLSFIFQTAKGTGPMEAFTASLITMAMGLFIIFITLPLFFKFGVEKGRYIIIIVFFIPALLAMFLPEINISVPDEKTGLLLSISGIFVFILAGVISVSSSLAVYRKKEM